MKNRLIALLVVVMIIGAGLVGCGAKEKVNEALIPDNTDTVEQLDVSEDDIDTTGDSSDLAARAKEEGVSTSEMQRMIEELTAMTAEKYGDTYENYVATLEENGKTPFDEFAAASDHMGITIKEYYAYEKNKSEMSQEDKETMQGMQDAMIELDGIDIEALENQANDQQENAQAMEKQGTNETTADILKIAKFEVFEVHNEENNEGAEYYGIEYTSKKTVSDVVAHFKDFLEGTTNYFIMDSSPAAGVVSGTVNGNDFEISCERDFDKDLTYITVVYYGVI